VSTRGSVDRSGVNICWIAVRFPSLTCRLSTPTVRNRIVYTIYRSYVRTRGMLMYVSALTGEVMNCGRILRRRVGSKVVRRAFASPSFVRLDEDMNNAGVTCGLARGNVRGGRCRNDAHLCRRAETLSRQEQGSTGALVRNFLKMNRCFSDCHRI
jgi:hypothetical protein